MPLIPRLHVAVALLIAAATHAGGAVAQDPRVGPAADMLLKTCFSSGAVFAQQGGELLEAMGATRLPSGKRPAMRQYVLESGKPLGRIAVSLEGTYCVASIASSDLDAAALARDIHTRVEPRGAVRTDAPGPVGVPPDQLVAAWEIPVGNGTEALIVRAFLSDSGDTRKPRMVMFGRFIEPASPIPPPPTAPETFDAPGL